MAATGESLDLKEILSAEDVPFGKFHELRREVHCHMDLRTGLENLMADFGAVAKKFSSENRAEVRRGVGRWLLGQVEEAIRILEPARAGKERAYFLGLCYLDAGRASEALGQLEEASKADAGDPLISLACCEAEIQFGKHEEAAARVERLVKKNPGADEHYLKGLLADVQGYHEEALQAYEKALEADPAHPKALFRLAYIMDLSGEDERALELYEQLRKLRPTHLHTAMNLGVLYEDRGDYERAVKCYESVLDFFPNHARARLFMRDAQASLTMFYDEEAARREAKNQQILAQPVADIPFSPRVKNALQKLGVTTLGDLVQKTEEDLLDIPNFGRTSLREVKEFLNGKGLAMATAAGAGGMILDDEAVPEPGVPAGEEVFQRNLSDIEWPGRIRKVFEKMGIVTVGDLLSKTEADLLKNKNLGTTSIKEIRKKLGALGLSMQAE